MPMTIEPSNNQKQQEKSATAERNIASQQRDQQNRCTSNDDSKNDKTYRLQRRHLWIQFGLLLATTVAVIAASIYAGFAYLQWQTMNFTFLEIQKQTESAQISANAAKINAETSAAILKSSITSFRQQVRPYIVVENTLINAKPHENGVVGIESVLRNTGTTPALNFRISHTFTFQPKLPCSIPPIHFERSASKINIGANLTRSARVFGGRGLLKSEVDSIENKTLFICYTGVFRYEDIFGETHETKACAYYKPAKPDTSVGQADLFLWGCPGHNSVR